MLGQILGGIGVRYIPRMKIQMTIAGMFLSVDCGRSQTNIVSCNHDRLRCSRSGFRFHHTQPNHWPSPYWNHRSRLHREPYPLVHCLPMGRCRYGIGDWCHGCHPYRSLRHRYKHVLLHPRHRVSEVHSAKGHPCRYRSWSPRELPHVLAFEHHPWRLFSRPWYLA